MQIILANDDRYKAFVARAVAEKTMAGEAVYAAMDRPELTVAGGAAIIPVCGPLSYRSDFWSWLYGGCSYDDINYQIAAAEGSRDVDQIILMFDTPGGEVTGIEECADNIYNSKKPTSAVIDPECASAGLWLASQCDKVYSTRSGMVGSLGVMMANTNQYEYLKELGIDIKIFRASISPNKNLGMSVEPRSEEADKKRQAQVDKWGDRFVAAVARGRGVTAETVLAKFGQGEMLDAQEATSVGLIDGISTVNALLASNPKRRKSATASGVTYRRAIV